MAEKKVGFLTDENGNKSMRRLLAFLFSLYIMAIGVLCVIRQATWSVVAVSIGIPAIIVIFMLFFTTWTDVGGSIKDVAGAIKK